MLVSLHNSTVIHFFFNVVPLFQCKSPVKDETKGWFMSWISTLRLGVFQPLGDKTIEFCAHLVYRIGLFFFHPMSPGKFKSASWCSCDTRS